MTNIIRQCKKCNTTKSLIEFPTRGTQRNKNNEPFYRHNCLSCESKLRLARGHIPTTEEFAKRKKKRNYLNDLKNKENVKFERKNNLNQEKYIAMDSKTSDRKHNRENNMTKEFIKKQIEKGCLYCEDTNSRMTMDRIDNSIGHIESNVNPACCRCNDIRGSMPYEAWLEIVPLLKGIREKGLYGNWKGGGNVASARMAENIGIEPKPSLNDPKN